MVLLLTLRANSEATLLRQNKECASALRQAVPFAQCASEMGLYQRRLNEKTGRLALIMYKTNGQRAVLNLYAN